MERVPGSGRLAWIVLCLLAASAGCESPPEGKSPGPTVRGPRSIRIVASLAPLASLARRIGGEQVEVMTLVPAGASEHTWEPAPRDAVRLSRADLFFEVGLGFEAWASRLVGADRATFAVVDASEGVDLLSEDADHDHGAGDRGEGRSANPHYWLDPTAMKPAVRRLAQALEGLDPSGAGGYRDRAASALADLDALDAEIRSRVDGFTSKQIITFHAAWDYFARRYGLQVIATLEEFPGKEPGPRHLERIVALVRERRIRAVFAEPQFPAKAAEAVAAECGVPVLLLDPLGGESVRGRSDYFSLMRYNVETMERALR